MDELKQEYIKEILEKVYKGNDSMLKYYQDKISSVFKTEDGKYICFDKPRIQTRFCFGYDERLPGDFESACSSSHVKEEYFIEKNIKKMKKELKELKSNKISLVRQYKGQHNLVQCVTESYKGRYTGEEYFDLSDSDKEKIMVQMEAEIAKFEKRLKTYLKRYGLTKLHTWTYSQND